MSSREHRVNEIDLLRFLAALSVVLFHYSFRGYTADSMSVMPYPPLAPFAKYGALGVELFFMISGFVILMTAANGSLRSFVVSRVVRLYPAFWVCCTITFLATLAIGAPRFSASVGQYLVNMTMLSGFVGVSSIDNVYWSLFVELQFYALVALLLTVRGIHLAERCLVAWLLASVALEFEPIGAMRRLLIADYSAYFIAGATCFLIWSSGYSRARIAVLAGSWALAISQAVSALPSFEEHFNVRMSAYVVAAVITAFFALMLLVALRKTGVLARKRWLLVGVLTYPLYLIHENVGFMIFNVAYPHFNAHLVLWATLSAALACAYAVHVFVERPLSPPMKRAICGFLDQMRSLGARASGRAQAEP